MEVDQYFIEREEEEEETKTEHCALFLNEIFLGRNKTICGWCGLICNWKQGDHPSTTFQ